MSALFDLCIVPEITCLSIKLVSGHKTPFLRDCFVGSGSGVGSTVEPLSAVPLNDELQRARTLVAKAESDVLLSLTKKVANMI